MQKRFQDEKEEGGMVKGFEIVRAGPMELPSLPLWNVTQSPLQLSDWLLLIEPIVADLSASADVWWKTVVQESEVWYQAHNLLSPLERLQHGHEVPLALNQTRWQRLERRVSTMMLQAVPDQIREELVSSRRMSVFDCFCDRHPPLRSLLPWRDFREAEPLEEPWGPTRDFDSWWISCSTTKMAALETTRNWNRRNHTRPNFAGERLGSNDKAGAGVKSRTTLQSVFSTTCSWNRYGADPGQRDQVRDALALGMRATLSDWEKETGSSYQKWGQGEVPGLWQGGVKREGER